MNKNQPKAHLKKTDNFYRNVFETASDGLVVIDLESGLVLDANPKAFTMHGCALDEFIGLKITELIHPHSQTKFDEHFHAFKPGGIFDIQTRHLGRDGSIFDAEWRGTAFTYNGQQCLLGIVRDVSKRLRAEQLLHDHVETHTHEQATLLQISHTLASTLEFQPGLILDQLREIVLYTHGGLFALENTNLISLAIRGTSQLEQLSPLNIQLGTSENVAVLFNSHRPIRIADVWSDTPQAQFLQSHLSDTNAILIDGIQSWMWVPLAVRGRIIGCIGIAENRKNYFTAHHADLALSVANQAAITMINAELYEHAQALAVVEERQRLAHNLHDAVNQSLFSAGLIAEVLPRLWDRDESEARRSLEDLRRLTRGAQAEMRALLAELRPSTLTDSNLSDLLRLLCNAFTGRTNIQLEMSVNGECNLPADTQVAIYRICQEALSNIAKHAKASEVEMTLQQTSGELVLYIHDNGRGFDHTKLTQSGHYGMQMMKERADAVGVNMKIISQPGQGTEITIHWKQQEAL